VSDSVNHPSHYNAHPSGVECIDVVEHMGFNLGNAIKYIWRADEKGSALEDLRKAAWYVDRELQRRQAKHCATCDGRGWVEVGAAEWNQDTRSFDADADACPSCTPLDMTTDTITPPEGPWDQVKGVTR